MYNIAINITRLKKLILVKKSFRFYRFHKILEYYRVRKGFYDIVCPKIEKKKCKRRKVKIIYLVLEYFNFKTKT